MMVDRSSEGARETWFVQRACKPAKMLRPRAAEPIRAGGHTTTAPKAGHMTASDTQQHARKLLQDGGHPHMMAYARAEEKPLEATATSAPSACWQQASG